MSKTRFLLEYNRCERCKRFATSVQAIREGWVVETSDSIHFTYICPGCTTLDEEREGDANQAAFEAAYHAIKGMGAAIKAAADKEREA